MKIAISGNGFGRVSFAQMLEVVRSVGVNFIELVLGVNLKGKEELHEVLDQLCKYNIAVACISVTGRFSSSNIKMHQQFICEGIDIAASLGVRFVNTYCAQTEHTNINDAIEEHARRMEPCIRAAEEKKITLLIESELTRAEGNPSRTADAVKRLIERVNSSNFKVTYEPANLYVSGSAHCLDDYNKLRQHIVYVHLKDVARCTPELREKYPDNRVWKVDDEEQICLPVGSGEMPFDEILGQLEKDGYNGFLTLEPFNRALPFRKGIEYMTSTSRLKFTNN